MSSSLTDRSVRIVPLGGLGEIGMNCLALEQPDGIVVIDCGVEFPFVDLGVDVIHPDFRYLIDRGDRVRGVFLTHGHEDHIGGLPYLLRQINVPVWGPPHALGLVQRRLAEHGLARDRIKLRVAETRRTYAVGPYTIEPVRVTHSIVEATALAIETRAGTIVHSGDFNLDPDPPDGEPTDSERLMELGRQGVRLLLSDSTNVDVAERTGSEKAVGSALGQLIRSAPYRVVIVMFASNVQRLMLLFEHAVATRRKLCLLGRSLRTHVEVAREIKRLSWPSDLLVSPEQAAALPREQVLILAGGSQAEERSAMRRLASGVFTGLKLEPEDTVILSSRIIPGNERPVLGMITDLLRQGIIVRHRFSDPDVHTSGHAGRSEQSRLIEWLKPRAFMPVHGTLYHMQRHRELARGQGIKQTLVIENGTSAHCDEDALYADDVVPHGKVFIAAGGERLDQDTLRRRSELGRSGLIVVSLALDAAGRLLAAPKISARGIPLFDEDARECHRLADEVVRAVRRCRGKDTDLGLFVRRAVQRRVEDVCGCRPIIDVHTHSIEA